MKILDILPTFIEPTNIYEMSEQEIHACQNSMRTFFRQYQINPVITTHAFKDRFLNDSTRQNVTGLDVYNDVTQSFERYKEKILKNKQTKTEFIGVVHNNQTNLNVIYSIDYDRPAMIDPKSGVKINNLKIITAIVSDNFKSDDYPTSRKMFV